MNKIPNRQAICEVLMEKAKTDRDIMVLCSDSRGSASMTPFAQEYPDQFVEVGIAEQNLVCVAAGLASYGFKPYITSFTPFATRRVCDQLAISVLYADLNVKVIGTDPGIAAELNGGTHMSMEDIGRTADRILVMNGGKAAMFDETKKVFARGEELERMGLRVPQITKILAMLQKDGYPVETALTLEQAIRQLMPLLEEGGRTHG